MEKLLVNVPEAQEMLGVGRTRLYELVSSGAIPVVMWGRSIRIPVKALKEWVEANQKDAAGLGQ